MWICFVEPLFNTPNCEYDEKDVDFGGANAGILIKLGNSYPAIFKCEFGTVQFLCNLNACYTIEQRCAVFFYM